MFHQAKKKAFTLLELIVVIVVLGILAAIAVPTFQGVIKRSQDETTLRSLEALTREAQALAAFDQTPVTDAHMQEAAADMPQAADLGVHAAGAVLVDASVKDPTGGEVAYKIVGQGLVLAKASASGQVCIVGANTTSIQDGSCRPSAAPSSAPVVKTLLADAAQLAAILPTGTSTSGSGTTTPPATPPSTPAPDSTLAYNSTSCKGDFSWSAVPGASMYVVRWSLNKSSWNTLTLVSTPGYAIDSAYRDLWFATDAVAPDGSVISSTAPVMFTVPQGAC